MEYKKPTPPPFTEAKKSAAEAEIKAKQKEIKYDLRDFTIDYLVKEFGDGLFYIPDWQRKFIWDEPRKCRFIESVLLGLPIPMMFMADLDDGRLEVVDGAQRLYTLEAFKNGDLRLAGLDRLGSLDGAVFTDLTDAQQRKFGTRALRMVILEDSTTPETRQALFDRINTSPLKARGSEVRRGAFAGPFADFLKSCGTDGLFRRLCPITDSLVDRRENEELVLRFFVYSDKYKTFKHDVNKFLDGYAKEHRSHFAEQRMRDEFDRMLRFVSQHFPAGFAKTAWSKSTPRVRFEAISVGVNLALRADPNLVPPPVSDWINGDEFKALTTTHASNSGPRLRGRVEFVRDKLLGKGGNHDRRPRKA